MGWYKIVQLQVVETHTTSSVKNIRDIKKQTKDEKFEISSRIINILVNKDLV